MRQPAAVGIPRDRPCVDASMTIHSFRRVVRLVALAFLAAWALPLTRVRRF